MFNYGFDAVMDVALMHIEMLWMLRQHSVRIGVEFWWHGMEWLRTLTGVLCVIMLEEVFKITQLWIVEIIEEEYKDSDGEVFSCEIFLIRVGITSI